MILADSKYRSRIALAGSSGGRVKVRFLAAVISATVVGALGAELYRRMAGDGLGALEFAFSLYVFWPLYLLPALVVGIVTVALAGVDAPDVTVAGRRRTRAVAASAALIATGGFYITWLVAIGLVFAALLPVRPWSAVTVVRSFGQTAASRGAPTSVGLGPST
jgi:hypothetical protein